jgi:hypothetical protein
MKPTVIGGASVTQEPTLFPAPAVSKGALAVPPLSTNALIASSNAIGDSLTFSLIETIPLRDIATMQGEVEAALTRTLDSFLARITQVQNPRIFELIKKLGRHVDEQKLPVLADRILNGKPSFVSRIFSLRSKEARENALAAAWEETRDLARGTTKTLVDVLNDLDIQLKAEQRKVDSEIITMEKLIEAYRERYTEYAAAVRFMRAFLEESRARVEAYRATVDVSDPVQKMNMDELDAKLIALESRTLALDGMMTRLPADQIVIRQLQDAAISTLQETTTTATSRFASIKMTLLALHAAMGIKDVQVLAQQGAELDAALASVRGKLVKDVVTQAVNAPGDNRIAQARQITQIVTETRDLMNIVEQGRLSNQQKFADARRMFADAREHLLAIGQSVNPGVQRNY